MVTLLEQGEEGIFHISAAIQSTKRGLSVVAHVKSEIRGDRNGILDLMGVNKPLKLRLEKIHSEQKCWHVHSDAVEARSTPHMTLRIKQQQRSTQLIGENHTGCLLCEMHISVVVLLDGTDRAGKHMNVLLVKDFTLLSVDSRIYCLAIVWRSRSRTRLRFERGSPWIRSLCMKSHSVHKLNTIHDKESMGSYA